MPDKQNDDTTLWPLPFSIAARISRRRTRSLCERTLPPAGMSFVRVSRPGFEQVSPVAQATDLIPIFATILRPRSSAVATAPSRIAAVKDLVCSEMNATVFARFITDRLTKLLRWQAGKGGRAQCNDQQIPRLACKDMFPAHKTKQSQICE